jgi:hypothetical protein
VTFSVGDKVIMTSGPEAYREQLGVGIVYKLTATRVCVEWSGVSHRYQRKCRYHSPQHLQSANEQIPQPTNDGSEPGDVT